MKKTIFFIFLLSIIYSCNPDKEGKTSEVESEIETIKTSIVAENKFEFTNEMHLITVNQPEGFTDDVLIKASIPQGTGPFPMIIHAHGSNIIDIINCKKPGQILGISSREHFAELGYLVISIGYRTRGPHLPVGRSWKYRDSKTWDSRALLAAAHWGINSGFGTNKVAFMGSSAGTWSALWAVSNEPELADLQQGLDMKAVFLAGESGNHIANDDSIREGWILNKHWSTGIAVTMKAIVRLSTHLRIPAITKSNLNTGVLADELAKYVQPSAIKLFETLFLNPSDESIPQCAGADGRPPLCAEVCAEATYKKLVADGGLLEEDIPKLILKKEGLDTISWWSPPKKVIPTANDLLDNTWLKSSFNTSPSYALKGFSQSPPAIMHLLSTNDGHYKVETKKILKDKLLSLGVSDFSDPEITSDDKGICKHQDYYFKEKDCGYKQVVEKLKIVFN